MKQVERSITNSPGPARRRRPRLLRYLLAAITGLLLLGTMLIGVAVFWLFIRPLPQTGGTLVVPGLSAEVKVTRDKAGVPHIYAASADDLFFSQGYVTAQDRLWQLDFNRRVGAGRLAEVLGQAAVEDDRFLRTLGLRRAAAAELPRLTPESRRILENYARGVNAFIDTHRDSLPVEFSLLGYTPEPWTILDSINWAKVMAFDLSGNYNREILRAALVEKLGPELAARLMPTTPALNTPLIVPPNVSYKGIEAALSLPERQAGLMALAGSDLAGRGSNNWVVAGSKSATGRPILSNDPHLGIRNPGVWYEVQLSGGGWNVAGVTFPGVPGVVLGHNDRIAWGVTNVEGDTQDLYLEKLNPANPAQYEYQGQWLDLQIIPEEIKIKNKPAETLNVRITRHGPLLNDVTTSLKDSPPMALQWVALRESPLFESVMMYDRARNWTEFREALRRFNIPAQNFVYADVDGNIGYQVPGLWPVRAKGNGLLPVPGWSGEYEWTGYAPFEELPSLYNPAAGYVVTANNRPLPANPRAAFSLGEEFDPGWRAARITQLVQAREKLSVSDMAAIQADVLSLPGREIAAYLGDLPASDPRTAEAIRRLKAWDGRLTADSVPGAIYKVTYQYLLENLYKPTLGDTYDQYLNERFHLPAMLNLLKEPQNGLWGSGGRDAMLQKALGQALDYLNGRFGGNLEEWRWGKLHTLSFAQTPLGPALPAPLQLVMNLKTIENGGDGTTVAAASYRYSKGYTQTSGAAYRGIMSLANWDDSLIISIPSQSGQPFNPHYGDNIDPWKGGQHHPFLFSPAVVEQNKENVLILSPR